MIFLTNFVALIDEASYTYSTADNGLTKRDLGADRLKPWCCLKRPAAEGALPNKDPHRGRISTFSVPLDPACQQTLILHLNSN